MRVLVCYTPRQLRDETRAALKQHALGKLELCFVKIDPTDERAYGRRIAAEWRRQRTFAIVEPDIVIRPDVVAAFRDCPCGYCAFPYELLTDVMPALGCTRFRRSFIVRYPDLADQAMSRGVGFRQFDVTLQRALLVREHGEQPHVHLPAVVHLNEAKRLLPEASSEPLLILPAW